MRLLTALALLIAGTLLAALSGYMIAGWPAAFGVLWFFGAIYTGAAGALAIAAGFSVFAHIHELFQFFEMRPRKW